MILVTGCARSGTSVTTHILKNLGAYLGRDDDVNEFYENTAIREGVVKPHLASLGADPRGQGVLPSIGDVAPLDGLREAVEMRFAFGAEPFAYKDAKLSLVWPAWAEAFPHARWVVVRRERDEIVDSCIRTHFMDHWGDDRDAWGRWVDANNERLDQVVGELGAVEVWPREFMTDPHAFGPVAAHCRLAFDPDALRAAVDPDKFRAVAA